MVRWFISPVVTIDITDGGKVLRRFPRLCYGDKYSCVQWGAVFFDSSTRALVRFEVDSPATFAQDDYIEELTTPEQWAAFYTGYPEMKNRWSDQP